MSWAGKILRVDLTAGTVKSEPLNMDWARAYIGSRGLATKYIVEEVDPKVDPLSPDNKVIWATDYPLLPFDRTVSLGAEIGGGYWQRGADAIGLALGLQRTSADFRTQSATVDANGDGLPDYGFVAAGWEQVVEAYYRFRVHQRFELTPDFQYIRHPAGNASADAVKIVGVRANLSF